MTLVALWQTAEMTPTEVLFVHFVKIIQHFGEMTRVEIPPMADEACDSPMAAAPGLRAVQSSANTSAYTSRSSTTRRRRVLPARNSGTVRSV